MDTVGVSVQKGPCCSMRVGREFLELAWAVRCLLACLCGRDSCLELFVSFMILVFGAKHVKAILVDPALQWVPYSDHGHMVCQLHHDGLFQHSGMRSSLHQPSTQLQLPNIKN